MSSIKAWLYSGRSSAAAAAPTSASSEPDDTTTKEQQKAKEDVTSSLPDMSEQSRTAAAGMAGEYFADMALGDGFGALVSFNSTSASNLEEVVATAAAEEEELGTPKDADANADTCRIPTPASNSLTTALVNEPPQTPEIQSTAQVVPEPDFLLDGDGFGAILCAEMEEEESSSEEGPRPPPPGALYPEVANWLTNTGDGSNNSSVAASSDVVNGGKLRPASLIQRFLFPPSKLIVDGTLISSPTTGTPTSLKTKFNSGLEVDFPPDGRQSVPSPSAKKRDRSLISTARLGSVVGTVSRRSSQVSSNKAPQPPPPQSMRSNQVLLWGATTVEAHYQQIRHALETARAMHGADGLRACGFEYRPVACEVHAASDEEEKINSKTIEESLGQQRDVLGDNDRRQIGALMKSSSNIGDADSDPERTIIRGRSQSDAGVSYGSLHDGSEGASLPNSAPTSHHHHQMIIVPSYASNVGDLVESAAIRERKVRGFADSGTKLRSMVSVSSETSLSTIFDNMLESDDDADSVVGKSLDSKESENVGGPLNQDEAKQETTTSTTGRFPDEQLPDHEEPSHCFECECRLFHVESNTMITGENLLDFIAYGDMYDEICRMCQEYAQEQMVDEGGLIWATICEDSGKGNPIRALVDEDHSERPGPILLVITGKGKVRTGIFSRQHLMTTGIEASTALPMVRGAKRRGMKVAMIDPNARGEREGMSTFEMSVRALFGHTDWNKEGAEDKQGPFTSAYFNPYLHDCPLYVLAHSAAGGQLCRYLLDQAHHMLPQIACIAFTDSTHNIQWAKRHESLSRLLESPACVYLRSSNVRNDDDWASKQAGDVVEVDRHWRRRFGNIQTLWAGTAEHSLIVAASFAVIWEHFDRFRIPDLGHLGHVGKNVTTFQAAIENGLGETDDKETTRNGEVDKGDHEDNCVSTFESGGSLLHRSKRDRSLDLVTL